MISIPTIAASAWNKVRAMAKRSRPLQGVGLYFTWTSNGVIVALRPAAPFKHPWQLAPGWRDPDPQSPIPSQRTTGNWISTVFPGFLNGGDVTINEQRLVKGAVTSEDVTLIDDTAPSLVFAGFRDPAASSGLSIDDTGELIQGAGEGYPDFFISLGVVPVAKAGDPNQDSSDPNRTCQIRAADVVLVTQRPSAAQDVTILDATTDSQDVAVSTTITAAADIPPSLKTVPQWSPPVQPTAADLLNGDAVEPTTDELKISTLYLVSPAGADPESDPDETWSAYTLYFAFWNLAHCSQAPVLVAPPDPLQLQVPLADGVGQGLIDAMLAPVNDEESATSAYLNTVTFQGMYWAPSGTGWDTATRPVKPTVANPIQGFSPSAVKQANADNNPPAPAPVLNPAFPCLRTRFDPFFFGLQNDPPTSA